MRTELRQNSNNKVYERKRRRSHGPIRLATQTDNTSVPLPAPKRFASGDTGECFPPHVWSTIALHAGLATSLTLRLASHYVRDSLHNSSLNIIRLSLTYCVRTADKEIEPSPVGFPTTTCELEKNHGACKAAPYSADPTQTFYHHRFMPSPMVVDRFISGNLVSEDGLPRDMNQRVARYSRFPPRLLRQAPFSHGAYIPLLKRDAQLCPPVNLRAEDFAPEWGSIFFSLNGQDFDKLFANRSYTDRDFQHMGVFPVFSITIHRFAELSEIRPISPTYARFSACGLNFHPRMYSAGLFWYHYDTPLNMRGPILRPKGESLWFGQNEVLPARITQLTGAPAPSLAMLELDFESERGATASMVNPDDMPQCGTTGKSFWEWEIEHTHNDLFVMKSVVFHHLHYIPSSDDTEDEEEVAVAGADDMEVVDTTTEPTLPPHVRDMVVDDTTDPGRWLGACCIN